jgi:hypothetical protein
MDVNVGERELPTPIADGSLARTKLTLQLRIQDLDRPFIPLKLPQKSGEKKRVEN